MTSPVPSSETSTPPTFPATAVVPVSEPVPIPLTVTHVHEHLYCPRFTYFEHVLCVPERQERRPLVQRGRLAHEERKRINPHYLRRKLGVVKRDFDVPMSSPALGVRGIVDEVLTLADATMAPFDYKFAEDPGEVYHNQKVQSALYGLLIHETFGVQVRRGFLCYIRSKHRVVEVPHGEEDFAEAREILREVLAVIRTGLFPEATRWKARCRDCCYRNICIR
jgi:CRISPR-associated exonuclease Cas4